MHRLYSRITPPQPPVAAGDTYDRRAIFLTAAPDPSLVVTGGKRPIAVIGERVPTVHPLAPDALIWVYVATTPAGWWRIEKVEVCLTPPASHRTAFARLRLGRCAEFDSLESAVDALTDDDYARGRLRIIHATAADLRS